MIDRHCPDLAGVDLRLLPPQLRNLVRLIGLPETVKLLRARGGRPTYIPANPGQAKLLKEVLCDASLTALAREYGNQTIDLPKADKVLKQIRDQYILQACSQGCKSGRELAEEFGLTWRSIKYIKAKARQQTAPDNPSEPDLFHSRSQN